MSARLDPSGFADLCEGVIKVAKRAHGPLHRKTRVITVSGLRRLLAAAYQASLHTYEGEFRSFTMAVRDGPFAIDGEKCFRLRSPWPQVTGVSLRELARLFPGSPLALSIHEDGRELICDGIVDRRRHLIGHSSFIQGDISELIVHVLGPGELFVEVGGPGWHLRAGSAVPVQPFAFMPPLHDLGRGCWHSCLTGEPDEQTIENLSLVTRSVLASLLQHAAVRRCGGAFAFLPSVADAPLSSMRRADTWPEFAKMIYDWYEADRRLREMSTGDSGYRNAELEVRSLRALVESAVRSISAASTLDGCTVFDAQARLHGFGAKIVAKPERTEIEEIDVKGAVVGSLDLTTKGTRHASAAALVERLPGAIVVVLSQDGGIRVFQSDYQGVCRVTLECRAQSLTFDAP